MIIAHSFATTGVAGWKLRSWLRRRKGSESSGPDSSSSSDLCASPMPEKILSEKRSSMFKRSLIDIETGTLKPFSRALLLPGNLPEADSNVGWVPQIRTVNGVPFIITDTPAVIAKPQPTVSRESRFSRLTAKVRSPKPTKTTFEASSSTSPDTSRRATTVTPLQIKKQKSVKPVPLSRASAPHVPLPVPPSITISEAEPTDTVPADNGKELIKSPKRTDSFIQDTRISMKSIKRLTAKHGSGSEVPDKSSAKRLPRLVHVVHLYTPSMEDELPIKLGEVLRLTQEFKDGWCAVQRVGNVDSEKGVVPNFCIEDRPDFVHTASGRYSRFSKFSQHSGQS